MNPLRPFELVLRRLGFALPADVVQTDALRSGRVLVRQDRHWEDGHIDVFPPNRVRLRGPEGTMKLERIVAVAPLMGIETDWLGPDSLRCSCESGGLRLDLAGPDALMNYLVRAIGTDDADDQLDALR